MNKFYSVLAASVAILAATASADAGFGVRLNVPDGFSQVEKAGCGGGHARAFRRHVAHQSARRSKRNVEVASRAPARAVAAAKVEPKPAVAEENLAAAADTENSTVAIAGEQVSPPQVSLPQKKPAQSTAAAPDDNPGQQVATAVKDIGCKSFFATVGMTLSVPCAK